MKLDVFVIDSTGRRDLRVGHAITARRNAQSGRRRVTKGSFEISVHQRTPVFSCSVTVDTVK